MRKFITASAAALALTGATLGASAADAQRWGGRGYNGGYHGYHRGGGAGWAVGAGILGLAAGAAIASSSRPYYGGYGGGYGYYAPPPPPPGYYGGGYCRSAWRWDGYIGRYVRVRYCD